MKSRRETIEVEVEEDDDGPDVGDGGRNNGDLFHADWWGLWEKYRLVAVFVLGILTLGTMAVLSFWPREPSIEILSAETESKPATIFVDLAGAVVKQGVYELPAGSRVNDLLVRAGGLAAEADREWVAKNMNLAQEVADGAKIYVPATRESGNPETGKTAGVTITGKINLNSASVSELDSLWGIGEARAGSIIAGRPYQTVEELVEKKIVPANVFERIKEEIAVY